MEWIKQKVSYTDSGTTKIKGDFKWCSSELDHI